MTRLLTIVISAGALAASFCLGADITSRPNRVQTHKADRSLTSPASGTMPDKYKEAQPEARHRSVASREANNEDEPILVIFYGDRPNSWM